MDELITMGVRLDRASPLRVAATPIEVRSNGWRVYEGTAAFGNVVHPYPDLNPPRSEFRPIEESLADETLASAEGVPVTFDHPSPMDTPEGLLYADTTKDHVEGTVIRAWKDNDRFRVRLIVYTPELQAAIERGDVDLSLGYTQANDPTPGEFQGQRYDAVQRKIRINHLAVVGNARSIKDGQHARLDALQIESNTGGYTQANNRNQKMDELLKELSMSEDAIKILGSLSDADKQIVMGLLKAKEVEKPEEEAAEKEEDIAQDEKMIAPLEKRIADLEAAMTKKAAPRMDSHKPIVDVDAVIAAVEAKATLRFNQSQSFVESVRMDGHRAVTTDDAATVMLSTIKDNLPEMHAFALGELKNSRLDSLTAMYKSAERIRREGLLNEQAAAVVGLGGNSRLDSTVSYEDDTAPFILNS